VLLIRHGSGALPTESISTSSRSEYEALQAWVTLSVQSILAIATLAGSWAKTEGTSYLLTFALRGVQITLSVGTSHLVPALAPFTLHTDAAVTMGSTHNALLMPLHGPVRMNMWLLASSRIITLVKEVVFPIALQQANSHNTKTGVR